MLALSSHGRPSYFSLISRSMSPRSSCRVSRLGPLLHYQTAWTKYAKEPPYGCRDLNADCDAVRRCPQVHRGIIADSNTSAAPALIAGLCAIAAPQSIANTRLIVFMSFTTRNNQHIAGFTPGWIPAIAAGNSNVRAVDTSGCQDILGFCGHCPANYAQT